MITMWFVGGSLDSRVGNTTWVPSALEDSQTIGISLRIIFVIFVFVYDEDLLFVKKGAKWESSSKT